MHYVHAHTHYVYVCMYIYCIHMHIYIAYICILWFVWSLIWRLWLLLYPVLCQDLESNPPLSDCRKLVILRSNEGNKQDTSSHAETTGSSHPSGYRAIRSVPLAISVFNPCVGTVHAPDWWFCFTPVNSLLRFHLFLSEFYDASHADFMCNVFHDFLPKYPSSILGKHLLLFGNCVGSKMRLNPG